MRILVTRPEQDQAAVGDRLRKKGHEVVPCPLLQIVPLEVSLPDPTGIAGILFTSTNGVRVLAEHPEFQKLTDIPAIVVGEATGAIARACGLAVAEPAAADISGLAKMLGGKYRGQRVRLLHISGTERAGDLAALMGAGGPGIEILEVYDARPAQKLPASVLAGLQRGELDGCILMSPRTAAIYAGLVKAAGLGAQAGNLIHFCLSANVAGELKSLGLAENRIKIAKKPDLETLLAQIG